KRYQAIREGILLDPLEFFMESQDGTGYWLQSESSEIKIGDQIFYQISIQDVTEKKLAEENLRKSEHEYRNIIENTKEAIVIIDFEGKLLYISPQLSEMLKGRKIGKNSRFFSFIHKDDVNLLISYYKAVLKEKTFSEKPVEFRILPKHGDYIWFSSSSKNYYDDDGNVIGFISTLQDITSRKIAEQKVKESEEKYRLITEVSNDLIVLLNDMFEVEYVNETSLKYLLGHSKEDLQGKSPIIFCHPDDYRKTRRFLLKLFKDGENTQVNRVKHKNGSWKWFENKGKMFTDEQGNLKYLLISRDVNERIKAEKALEESEENYRLITENSNDLIRVVNDKFDVEYVNEITLRNLLGYTKDELLGRNSIILNHPDDYRKIRRFMLKIFRDGENVHISRVKHKNGTWLWFENKGKMFTDEQGNLKYLLISRDVNERIKAEKALEESEQTYRLITENSNDLIRVLSEDFKIEYLNEQTHQQELGYTREDLIGKYDIKLNHPDDYTKIRKYMLNLFKNKEGIHVSRIRHKNGYYLWFEVKAKMFTDEQGNQKYLFISRNITERRQTELALMESEEKYRNLYENSPNGVFLTNKHGLILDMNTSAERILGYSKNELLGRDYLEFNFVNAEQLSLIKNMYKKLLKGEKPKPIELQVKKKNGSIAWIYFQNSMIKLNNEIIIESIAQDISEKKKAENLIIEENKRLLELNKMKSELISRVSHELKTPITSIFGGTQILLELYKDQTCSDAIEFIELINRGGKRLKLLIENLLDASRIESEKLKLNLQKVNVSEIIRNCINDNRYLATKRNIIVELNLPDLLYLEIDKLRIEQVVTNLLSNAIKNTPKQGIIKIKLEEKGENAYFTVKDTGIGLTKQEMEKLFTKFGKIERYGQKMDVDIEGSGLGLYISKEIVDLHGGQIWVESEGRNNGSTFYVKLSKNKKDEAF
ncbi:MAG: PAS domain S-box protein, partial [Candidatus Hermodarchaeota archaeon]